MRRQPEVRPVEIADLHQRIAQAEARDDVLPHRRRGGRCQRQPDRRAERLGLRAEQQVIGAEIAAPLADQVRFIHGEQPCASPPQRVAGLCVGQLLGRGEHERVRIARGQQRRRPRAGRLLRVQHDRPQSSRPQVAQLIILQRDQRRDDDGGPSSQYSRQLVDR